MTSLYRISAVALVCTTLSACSQRIIPTESGGSANAVEEAPVEIGTPLYRGEYRPFLQSTAKTDPVVIPASQIVILRKQDLPSKVDGTLSWIGVVIDEATAAKLSPRDVYQHPRTKTLYRRLLPGDRVKRDQVVALINDERAYLDSEGANIKAKSTEEEVKAHDVAVAKIQEYVDAFSEVRRRDVLTKSEVLNAEATLAGKKADAVGKRGAADTAASDAAKGKLILDQHTLRAAIDGEVQIIARNEGEGVKTAEPILVIHNFDQLRAEGNLPKEYIGTIRPGDDVTLETPTDLHAGISFDQHTTNKPITAVKVGVRNGSPIIVSAAEDGWVYAWERNLNVLGSWKQSGAVRSLAVTPPGTDRSLLLVGCDTGVARLYDLANIGPQPLLELDGKHDGGVVAAAFSPDGKYLVTADERNIYLWDVATGKKKYDFNAREHHSLITSLSFTKQGRVISTAREPSVLVWMVGDQGAKVEHRFDARTGDVGQPGVSDDGSRLLLDADKTRLDVIHLKEGRKERPIITGGESARFHTFTAWSPELKKGDDTRLIATTSSNDGVVQLWRAPTSTTRSAEVARLITRRGAQVTDAAFSPVGENGFIVVGTKKGDVHLWELPNVDDLKSELRSTVTHVENLIESSGRTSRVLVDFENPQRNGNYQLRPGSTVTIVIQPSTRK
jgi:WD40 repeat protein